MKSLSFLPIHTIPLEFTPDNSDLREQLFNDGARGSSKQVQVSKERVAQLLGIFFDIDPPIIKPNPLIPKVPSSPQDFYYEVARHWFSRHPVLSHAEVRCSGEGLHAILRFDTPIVFQTDGERNRWDGIIKVVQATLPVDPDAPSITATTRPIGSTNSKNGAAVAMLKPGTPVRADEVLALYEEMKTAPFETVMALVGGQEEFSPCPFCQREGSKLHPGRIVGFCYGGCGRIPLSRLYELMLTPRHRTEREGVNHDHPK